jgi:membrane associated rhomboid family serine protease
MFPIKDNVQSRSFPIINWTLIGLNIVAFTLELSADARGQGQQLIVQLGVVPARFLHYRDAYEAATLITSMFLHGGWLHLISNMWALYIFGDNVEDRMGPVRYVIFYLCCGLAAGITHIIFNPHSTMPSVGASGAIAGVLGAYLMLFPTAQIIALIPIFFYPLFVEIPAVFFIVFWFVAQLLNGTMQIVQTAYSPEVPVEGGVAWWAHVGGFVAGMLLVWPFAVPRRKLPRRYADQYFPW